MNVKKFVAASSREALRLVRNELGDDALILSNRKVPDGVELVALAATDIDGLTQHEAPAQHLQPRPTQPAWAVPPARPTQAAGHVQPARQTALATAAPFAVEAATARAAVKPSVEAEALKEQRGILEELKSMHSLFQEQMASLSWLGAARGDVKRPGMMRDLLNAGFSPALARRMLEKLPDGADLSWVRQMLGNNLKIASQQDDVVTRGGVVALVGPTGVGKTTTTAKLAARAVMRHGADKVALLTTDTYRIGAHDQSRIYGKLLGVTVQTVHDTDDLRLTLTSLKHKHLVLIDTVGLSQRDSRVAEQTEMFNACGVKRLLLLNASSSGDMLDDVVSVYHDGEVIGCIPTKLDEAVTLGAVLDVAVRRKLVLHYITNGQRVPEDLHEVNLEYLLHRAFKTTARKSAFSLSELEFPWLLGEGSTTGGVQHAI